jgi:hypothetical protein
MGNEFDAIALVIAAIVGGIAGGAGAVVAFGAGVRAVLNSPVLIANGENLANSFPASVNGLLVDLGSLLVKLNDRVPEAEKPALINSTIEGKG